MRSSHRIVRIGARALAGVLVVAGGALALRHLRLPIDRLADAASALGPVAAAALPALYVPWMVLGIPTGPLALAAGFTLGSVAGGAVAAGGCTAGACAAFLVARRIGRGPVERLAARVPAVGPVRRAIRARGFRIVLLLRLAPVMPVPFLNHVLGVTSVSLGRYSLATLLGTLPSAFVAASVGALARSAGTHLGAAALEVDGAALAAGILVSVALGALAVRILSRELAAGAAAYDAARSAPPEAARERSLGPAGSPTAAR